MFKCEDIINYVDRYWTMDDNNPIKIEIEAHLCDCDHCAQLFTIEPYFVSKSSAWEDDATITADGLRISNDVMNRIYQENEWAMPVEKKTYSFSTFFKRNIGIAISVCLVLFFTTIFTFLLKDGLVTTNKVEANQTGVVDVVVAKSSSQSADVLSDNVAVASLSDPIIMEATNSFSQYYIALAIIAIIGVLLVLNWFARTKQ